MSTLSDSDGRESSDDSEFDTIPAQETSGWNATTDYERYLKSKSQDSWFREKFIRRANILVRLSSVIHKYGISWEIKESSNGWTHSARCPFPDHNDRTPSFGFNSKEEYFKCHGCQRGGGTVQFLSYLLGRPPLEISKELIAKCKTPAEDILNDISEEKFTEIDQILFEFNSLIRDFIKSHPTTEGIAFAQKITWSLDLYLERNGSIGALQLEPIKARIEKLSLRLKMY